MIETYHIIVDFHIKVLPIDMFPDVAVAEAYVLF